MAAHAVASNAHTVAVQHVELLEQGLRQLLRDVCVHVVALVVRFLGRIHVETGAAAKVVCVVFALDVQATCGLRIVRLASL